MLFSNDLNYCFNMPLNLKSSNDLIKKEAFKMNDYLKSNKAFQLAMETLKSESRYNVGMIEAKEEGIEQKEKEIRHDVMSHVYAFGKQCPHAKPIIHLGATSCFVGDNSDIIVMTQALKLIKQKIIKIIELLSDFAIKNKDIPTLAYTHFQAAQPTTVGKRATLWIQDLAMDIESINHLLDNVKLLGCKGTTGTQAS